ncbi:MAG: DUF1501 domain-containing protein [Rhodothermaceae bacterium]|nr:DUF1501 domain-containing protein [Rhodothermaceae bacterium]
MCDHHRTTKPSPRAIALEHGEAHDHDHAAWTRRDFLVRSGLAVAGGGAMLAGSMPVRALEPSALLQQLAALDTDRVLVILQLGGGNDGLNTVVPKTNDLYYQRRPTLAIAANETVALDTDYGLHPAMQSLEPTWGEGGMAVVHNVGYPDANLSHFRATDIWLSASDSEEYLTTGWAGRSLETLFPDFETAPPAFPPAVQIGTSNPLLFRGQSAGYGMALFDTELFLQIVQGEPVYDPAAVPPTPWGDELAFLRTVANDSFRYADAISQAYEAASNATEYPEGNMPASLAGCARLIKGGLGARIYLVSVGGFDTHANQADEHALLLQQVSETVAAFYADLAATGDADRVLTMTFSEFGRRIEENGSDGTDHGTAAPLFLFGGGVIGGLYGDGPDLASPDPNGNLVHSTDFRSVYATVLQEWFGLEEAVTTSILGGSFGIIPMLADPVATEPEGVPLTFGLEQNSPNPFGSSTQIRFTLTEAGLVRLQVFDLQGRLISTLVNEARAAGQHHIPFDADALPSGTYLYRLEAPEGVRTSRMTRVR